MKPEASNYQDQNTSSQNKPGRRSSYQMRNSDGVPVFPEISLSLILRHLWLSLRKLLVAVRYWVHSKTGGGIQMPWRMPWFKLALAALALFIVTKKDIQFSINLRAPLANMFETAPSGEATTTQQMSVVQPVSFGEAAPVSTKVPTADELDIDRARAYIKRFRNVAVVEMQKYRIPASIKMAQGLLESLAGEHAAAVNKNNHFGPVFSGQSFESAWANWRSHSLFLERTCKDLIDLGGNYRTWARGLQEVGYSADPQYAEKITEVIEKFQLYLLDEEK